MAVYLRMSIISIRFYILYSHCRYISRRLIQCSHTFIMCPYLTSNILPLIFLKCRPAHWQIPRIICSLVQRVFIKSWKMIFDSIFLCLWLYRRLNLAIGGSTSGENSSKSMDFPSSDIDWHSVISLEAIIAEYTYVC